MFKLIADDAGKLLMRGKGLYKSAFCYFKLLLAIFVLLPIATVLSAAQYWSPDLAGNDNFVNFRDFAVFAENWQKTGTGLQGDFDNSGKVDISDLAYLTEYWLAEYSEYQECQRVDINGDGIIAFEDFAEFAQNWLLTDGGLAGDFDDSNSVDCDDLAIMTDCWLKGSRPEGIWEQFKAALAAGDVNEAVTFFAGISAENYRIFFGKLKSYLPQMASDMGELIFIERNEEMAYYDLLRQENGEMYGYPVIFVIDETGQWEIYDF